MKYFENRNFIIDGATFTYQGALFDGKGFLNWDHREGFQVKLFVDSEEYETPKTQTFGAPKVIKKGDRNDIYLSLDSYGHKKTIVPQAYIGKRFSIDQTGTLSFRTPQLIFLKENFQKDSSYYFGNCIYRLEKKNYNFPENIESKEKIGNEAFREGGRNDGVKYKTEYESLLGWLEDNEYLHLEFRFKKDKYDQNFALNFPCGFRHAMSFLLGIELKRLKSEMNGKNSNVVVIKKLTEIKDMPVYQGLKSFKQFDSRAVWELAKFFTKGYLDKIKYQESYVARMILNQLIEAEQQETLVAQELLTATILEAALRTLFDVPSEENLYVPHYLTNNFIPDYADGAEWREVRKQVIKSFENMRHRNAHPDWLVKESDVYDDDNITDTFYDLRVMIKFYQQMVLLMAGIKDIEPALPGKI